MSVVWSTEELVSGRPSVVWVQQLPAVEFGRLKFVG